MANNHEKMENELGELLEVMQDLSKEPNATLEDALEGHEEAINIAVRSSPPEEYLKIVKRFSEICIALGVNREKLVEFAKDKRSRLHGMTGYTGLDAEDTVAIDAEGMVGKVKSMVYAETRKIMDSPILSKEMTKETDKLAKALEGVIRPKKDIANFISALTNLGFSTVSDNIAYHIDLNKANEDTIFAHRVAKDKFLHGRNKEAETFNYQLQEIAQRTGYDTYVTIDDKKMKISEVIETYRDKFNDIATTAYRERREQSMEGLCDYTEEDAAAKKKREDEDKKKADEDAKNAKKAKEKKEKEDEEDEKASPEQKKLNKSREIAAKVTKSPFRTIIKLMDQAKDIVHILHSATQGSFVANAHLKWALKDIAAKEAETKAKRSDEQDAEKLAQLRETEISGEPIETNKANDGQANTSSEQENGGGEQPYDGEREDLITKLKLLMLHNKTVTVVLSEGKFKNVSEDDKKQHLEEMISRYGKADVFMSRIGEYDIEKIQKKIDSYSVPKISNSEAIAKEFPEINITNPLQAGKCAQEMILESMNTESKLCDKTLQVFFGKNVTREQLKKLGIDKIKTDDMRQFNTEYERIRDAVTKGQGIEQGTEKLTGEEMENRFLAQRIIENRKKLMDDKGD